MVMEGFVVGCVWWIVVACVVICLWLVDGWWFVRGRLVVVGG